MTATPSKLAIRAEGQRLLALLKAAGAVEVDADILQPAELLLDLYGEDIRARAYVTYDSQRGEMMLRPDFTVPVVQAHMANGADPARYCYLGEVFRKQDHLTTRDGARTAEFLQLGYEIFDRADPGAADAEVFALFSELLAPHGLRAATGDIGILTAAVRGLTTSDRRQAALLRHIWRPRRFRALLERFGGITLVPATRLRMLQMFETAHSEDLIDRAGGFVGKRSRAEIAARVEALREDAAEPPIAGSEVALLENILSLREKSPLALRYLRELSSDLPTIRPALDRMEKRLEVLARRGVEVGSLDFEASYGRTTLEYYDGFVFGFYAESRPDLPPVASGGRYDALTRVLGQGRSIPAVGGVIRPAMLVALQGAAALQKGGA